MALEAAMVKQGATAADIKKATDAAEAARKNYIEAADRPSDEKILAAVAMAFYNDIEKDQHPIGFYEKLKSAYGALNDETTYKKWAKDVFDNTMILSDSKWNVYCKP